MASYENQDKKGRTSEYNFLFRTHGLHEHKKQILLIPPLETKIPSEYPQAFI